MGSPVNVTAIGYPYYATVVVECDSQYVTVKYPLSKTTNLHKYHLKDVAPFKAQVIGKTLKPIKYTVKTLSRAQKKI